MLTALLILACSSAIEPLPDVDAYAEAARIAPEDPAAAADLCARVEGEAGAECMALTAAEVSTSDLDLATQLCARVEEGVWRDECGFLVADGAVRSGHVDEAGPICAQAGRFADNCLMHVWKRHAAICVDQSAELQAASDCHQLSFAWSEGLLTADEGLEARFWDVFFDAAVGGAKGGAAHIDFARCEELTDETLRDRCEHVIPFTLQRALNRSTHKQAGEPGAMDRSKLCNEDLGDLQERVKAATGIHYEPHPKLDAVATRYTARLCGGGAPR